jgi:hypothetical protein
MGSYISTPVPKKDELAMRQAYSDAANFHEIFSYLCRHWQGKWNVYSLSQTS